MKLVAVEAESLALERFLASAQRRVSSALLAAETRRAALRIGTAYADQIEHLLPTVHLHAVNEEILTMAGRLMPSSLRTLDAIHLATALALRSEIDCVVTYDARMAQGAMELGLTVVAPA